MYQNSQTVFSVSFCSRHKCYISEFSVEKNCRGSQSHFFYLMLGLGPPLHCIWKIWEKMSKNDLFTNIGFRKKIKAKNEKSGSVFPWGMLQGLKWSISTILGALFVKKQLLSRRFWNPRWPPLVEIHFFCPQLSFSIPIWWYQICIGLPLF